MLKLKKEGVDLKLENNKWYNKEIKEVEKELQTNQERGLGEEEVKQRQEKYQCREYYYNAD